MKLLLGKLGVLFIGLLIFGYAEVRGADWKFYVSTDQFLGYYDKQSIIRPYKNIARVWTKSDYTEKGVLEWVGKVGKIYENLSHSIVLWEINCAEKRQRRLTLTVYDHKGSVINFNSSPSEWDFIVPESVTDELYKEVCK